jgi:hypothetical protein
MDINRHKVVGVAAVHWYSPEEGGRRSGPPGFEFDYVAMCRFDQDMNEVVNGLRSHVAVSSVLLKQIEPGKSLYFLAFITPEMVAPFLRAGAIFHVDEGVPRRACTATVVDMLPN